MAIKDRLAAAVAAPVAGTTVTAVAAAAVAWVLETYVFRGALPKPVATALPAVVGWLVHWVTTHLPKKA